MEEMLAANLIGSKALPTRDSVKTLVAFYTMEKGERTYFTQ